MRASPVLVGDVVYLFGGIRSSGSHAYRLAEKGPPTEVWFHRNSSYVATPLYHKGHLYWADDRGVAWCADAATGESLYRERLPELASGGRPVYASPVLAGRHIYVPTRWNGVMVLPAEPRFEILARNEIEGDTSDFNATPTITGNALLLRSNRMLYCVGQP